MRVLGACSLGGSGHLRPLLPLLDAAAASGHDTLILAPGSLAEAVSQTGHAFEPGGEPPAAEVAPIRDALLLASAEQGAVLGNRDLFGRLATTAMLPAMERLLDAWQPSLVLRETCEFASAVLAPSRGIPTAQVAIDLAEVEWRSLDIAAPALEAHRRGVLDELRRAPYVSRFPPSLDPSRFADTRRYAEPPYAEPPAGPSAPLPDWWAGSRAPLVYVTLGSVAGRMAAVAGAYRTVLEAVASMTGVRVLFTLGRGFEPTELGPLPAHVHVEAWVDQAVVLPEADVVVCHGGSGTSFGALAAGRPLVVVPMFAGQFANAARVQAAGAGLTVAGQSGDGRMIEPADAPRIRQAIETVRTDRSYASRAQAVATEMSEGPAPAEIVARLLDR